jgi:hypothetical protein
MKYQTKLIKKATQWKRLLGYRKRRSIIQKKKKSSDAIFDTKSEEDESPI